MAHLSDLILRVKTLEDALTEIAAHKGVRLTASDAERLRLIAENALYARTANPSTEEALDAAVGVVLQHKTVNTINSILKALRSS